MDQSTSVNFSQITGVSLDTAQRLLAVLMKGGYKPEEMGRMMYRLEQYILTTQAPAIIDAMSDLDIGALVAKMQWEDGRMPMERPNDYRLGLGEEKNALMFATFGEKGKVYAEGDKVKIQIMRTGSWDHPAAWKLKITPATLKEIKANFDSRERGIDLAVDENHEPNHKALAWYSELQLEKEDTELFGVMELTKSGAEKLTNGEYKYFSPEIAFNKRDEESGKLLKNLLVGGAFTNRPFFKAMTPLLASEEGAAR